MHGLADCGDSRLSDDHPLARILRVSCKRVAMKQNITLSLDKQLLKHARTIAAARGTSVSGFISNELRKLVEQDAAYEQAKAQALVNLNSPFRLGGKKIADRDSLHDRKNLR